MGWPWTIPERRPSARTTAQRRRTRGGMSETLVVSAWTSRSTYDTADAPFGREQRRRREALMTSGLPTRRRLPRQRLGPNWGGGSILDQLRRMNPRGGQRPAATLLAKGNRSRVPRRQARAATAQGTGTDDGADAPFGRGRRWRREALMRSGPSVRRRLPRRCLGLNWGGGGIVDQLWRVDPRGGLCPTMMLLERGVGSRVPRR